MPAEFAPAFGALLVDALVAEAPTWTLELQDAAGQRLCALRIVESSHDGETALRIATERGFGQRRGHAALYRLVDAVGGLLTHGTCGRQGSGAQLELRASDLVEFGTPISVAGTLRW